MLPKDLISDVMSKRNISLKIVYNLTEIKEFKLQQYLDGLIPCAKDMEKICKGLNIDENDITYDELSISVNEVSKIMTVSVNFVRNAVEKGKLPGICMIKNGKRIFHIPRLAIYTYMGMQSNSHYLAVIELLEQALKKSLPTMQSESDLM